MDYLEAVQLAAFNLVAKTRRREPIEDPDYIYRKIFRWYSKTFNTPLDKVYDLPVHDIITAYWEERYEGLDDNELEDERLELIKTDADRERDELIKNAEEIEIFNETRDLGEDIVDQVISETEKFKRALNNMRAQMGKETELLAPFNPPVSNKLPPDISYKFDVDEDDLADLGSDKIGLLDRPKKR